MNPADTPPKFPDGTTVDFAKWKKDQDAFWEEHRRKMEAMKMEQETKFSQMRSDFAAKLGSSLPSNPADSSNPRQGIQPSARLKAKIRELSDMRRGIEPDLSGSFSGTRTVGGNTFSNIKSGPHIEEVVDEEKPET